MEWIFSFLFLAEMVRNWKKPKAFLQNTIFNAESPKNQASEYIIVDYWDEEREIAPVIHTNDDPEKVTQTGGTSTAYQPAYSAQELPIRAAGLLKRLLGESGFISARGMEERAIEEMSIEFLVMRNRVTRLIEYMCAELLQTGKVTVTNTAKGVKYILDYQMPASHKITLAGGDKWDQTSPDICGQITDWADLIDLDAGLTADILILDVKAGKLLLKNADFLAKLDNLRVKRGEIEPRLLPNGVRYLGLLDNQIDVFQYSDWYKSGGTTSKYLSDNRAILTTRQMAANVFFGMIPDLDYGTFVGEYFTKTYKKPAPSSLIGVMASRPLPLLKQVKAIVSAVVA